MQRRESFNDRQYQRVRRWPERLAVTFCVVFSVIGWGVIAGVFWLLGPTDFGRVATVENTEELASFETAAGRPDQDATGAEPSAEATTQPDKMAALAPSAEPDSSRPADRTSPYYVALEDINIHVSPQNNAYISDVVFRNQVVRLLERKGAWMRVQYYDSEESKTRDGWVNERHLKHKR